MRVQLNVVQGQALPKSIELEAASPDDARQQAVRLGYTVLSTSASMLDRRLGLSFTARAQRIDVAVFVEQLRDLLVAGLSVIESLDALRRGAKGGPLQAIEQLERQLHEGRTLSDSLARDPVFPALLVALVRASEFTSELPQALARYLDHERRVGELRHRLVSTGIYPVLLMGVGLLVLLFLLFYVMPRFARVFEGMSGDLPWSARMMVQWARLLHAHALAGWLLLLGVPAALVAVLAVPAARASMFTQLMNWQPLRERLNTYFLARWYRATGLLVQGGIALPQALHLANELLPSGLRAAGRAVEQGVEDGLAPSAAHARAGMATAVAEQLLLAGERTGDLGTVLVRIAHFHESEASRTLERGMRAIEPLVMVLIGLGVGIVVVLMYLPIFELASAIQ